MSGDWLPPDPPQREEPDPATKRGKLVGNVRDALAALPASLHWRWVHIGGGARLAALRDRAAKLGLDDRIDWTGPQAQDAVLAAYRSADVFVLPSLIAGDGDRDGLPNVLMEAQSQGLAVVATRVSAVPELIEDGVNGLLVAPGDRAALAAALERLIRDPALRAGMGAAGERRVRDDFAMDAGIDDLAGRLAPPGTP